MGHLRDDAAVTDAKATVVIRTEVENKGAQEARVTVETAILDAAGKQAGRATNDGPSPPAASKPSRRRSMSPVRIAGTSTIRISTARRPRFAKAPRQSDRYVTPFGIRTIEYSRDKGFLLNGRPHRFNGVCMHHDLGALGAAVNRRALERQLEIMKSMGVNAIRTSHNPPAPELLELSDRMGLLVMDEAFDMWEIQKVRNGLSKYFEGMVERTCAT